MNRIPKDPRIKALASKAALKIKALTVAHQTQIAAIYQQFQEEAAQIQQGSADELHSPSASPVQSTASQQEENHHGRI